jgi:hypothetical protein
MYQQQGGFCCHPDRVDSKRVIDQPRGVAGADALIARGSVALASKINQVPVVKKPAGHVNLSGGENTALLRSLLSRIDPDSEYDKWVRAGMALYTETGGSDEGCALFNEWSSKGEEKYAGTAKTAEKWRSFRLDVEVPCKIGTLFWLANANGFSPEMIYAEVESFKKCGGQNGTN